MSQPNQKLEKIAKMEGRGPMMLFAVDTRSKPGRWICHLVQCQTIVLDDNPMLNDTKFTMIAVENDPRLDMLADCCHPPKE